MPVNPYIKMVVEARTDALHRAISSWWREACSAIQPDERLNPTRTVIRRLLLWAPVAVLAGAVLGTILLYSFAGWRARDFAGKAVENARRGSLQMARLQVISANNLRHEDPAVQRALLFVRSSCNDPLTPGLWEQEAGRRGLAPEEAAERARVNTHHGTDDQFDRAVSALEQRGELAKAAAYRSARQSQRGNFTESIREARLSLAMRDDPVKKLILVRLLILRHAPLLRQGGPIQAVDARAADEIIALVDQLQGTPQALDALALGLASLNFLPATADKAKEWAVAALREPVPSNPALLSAAEYMVASGAGSADEYFTLLSAAFAGAPPDQQAAFAHWLNRRGWWDRTLDLISPSKAAREPQAFAVRAEALAGRQLWEDMLKMSQAPANAPPSMRLAANAFARKELGGTHVAAKSLADAVRAGLPDGRLQRVLAMADEMGKSSVADPVLVEMCASPGVADAVFRVARDRFTRRGQFPLLEKAWAAASKASPDAPSVQDYRRRQDLLGGRQVTPEETAAAVEASPGDPMPRFTHALALLKHGRPAEALGVFHDIDVFVDDLAPGDKAIILALYQANEMPFHAANARRLLDTALLTNREYALIVVN